MNYYTQVKTEWKKNFSNKKFRLYFIVSLLFLAFLLLILPRFLFLIEARKGIALSDPLLPLLPVLDLTWLIFSVLYLSLAVGVIFLVSQPQSLLTAINSYSLMLLFRMAAMYLMPLEPPEAMIALNDPFVEFFGTGKLLTKDLFFSGHTATMLILFFNINRKLLRNLLLAGTFIIGASVILQNVHYCIDVFAAIFFSYSAYSVAQLISRYKISY